MTEIYAASKEQIEVLVGDIEYCLSGTHQETLEVLSQYVQNWHEDVSKRRFMEQVQALEMAVPAVFTVVRLWAREVRRG